MLKRCGDGYAWSWFALRFPSVEDDAFVGALEAVGAADSRFLSESFFSRCSRWMGGGTGVFDDGLEGTGAGAGTGAGMGAGAGDATAGANVVSLAVVVSGSGCVSGWAAGGAWTSICCVSSSIAMIKCFTLALLPQLSLLDHFTKR